MCIWLCDCRPAPATTGTGVGAVSLWLLRLAWRLAHLLATALVVALVWATPRAVRLSVRVTRAGWRRWQAVHVPPATVPVADATPLVTRAIEAGRSDITWTELQLKREANR